MTHTHKGRASEGNMRHMVPFAAIIVIQAVRYFPFKFGGWNQIQLSFTYDYGFVQRALLGSVLDAISRLCHIPWGYMRYAYGLFTMALFTVLVLGTVYKALNQNSLDNGTRKFLYCMGLLFFMGPGWNTFYNNFALTDVWLLMLSMLGSRAVIKGKQLWMAVAAPAVCILIHTGYVFMYFSLIAGVFVYKAFTGPDKLKRKYIFYGAVTAVVCSGLFVYMMFFSHVRQGITLDYVMERTAEFVSRDIGELEGHRDAIGSYLFGTDNSQGMQLAIVEYRLIFIVAAAMFLPFVRELYIYWKTIVKGADKSVRWVYFILPVMGVVMALPLYIMHSDYGRWTYAVVFYEFALIWILNITGDGRALDATKELADRVRQNKAYYLVLVFYVVTLGAMEQNLISPLIATVETYCWKLLAFL